MGTLPTGNASIGPLDMLDIDIYRSGNLLYAHIQGGVAGVSVWRGPIARDAADFMS